MGGTAGGELVSIFCYICTLRILSTPAQLYAPNNCLIQGYFGPHAPPVYLQRCQSCPGTYHGQIAGRGYSSRLSPGYLFINVLSTVEQLMDLRV